MPAHNVSVRAEQRKLRERMRGLGMSHAEIAAELARRYKLRPRTAWRTAFGWTLEEAAERYNALHGNGDPGARAALTGSRLSEWENWPFSARKPPIAGLCLLAEIYQVGVLDLVDFDDREKMAPAELVALGKVAAIPAARQDPGLQRPWADMPGHLTAAPGAPAFPDADGQPDRKGASPVPEVSGDRAAPVRTGRLSGVLAAASGGSAVRMPAAAGNGEWIDVGDLVMAVAEESSDRVAADAGRLVPSSRIEQLHLDVQRLARRYSQVPPLAFLAETRRMRDQAHRLARRTCRPGQLTELYVVTGQACALMSVASFDLAVWPAAIEQAHAALVFAEMADDRGLQAWARGMQGLIANWCGRPQEAAQLVSAGLVLASSGTGRARLHCISARAWSQLGAEGKTREAITAADRERELIGDGGEDELHDRIAGEFGWGPARQAMCTASALLRIGDPDRAAERAADAIRLHPADQTGSLVDMTARVDMAHAELARGRLDAAEAALAPVWPVAPEHRRHSLVGRLEGVAGALAEPRYVRARAAAALTDQIRVFAENSAPRTLPAMLEPAVPHVE